MKARWLAWSFVLAVAGVASIAACSSQDPHAVSACEGYLDLQGQPFTGTCEAACKKAGSNGGAPRGTGGTCEAVHGPSSMQKVVTCGTTLDFDGTPGCCANGSDGVADVEFYTCR